MVKNTIKPKPVRREPDHKLAHLSAWLAMTGKKQTYVADIAGIGKSHMSLLVSQERGSSMAGAQRIADALEITLSQLLNGPPGVVPKEETITLEGLDERSRSAVRNLVEELRRPKAD